VPGKMSVLSDLLSLLADLNVCADMLAHSTGYARADITFALPEADLSRCRGAVERFAARLGGGELRVTTRLAKVSLIGAGLRSDPRVLARLCSTLLKDDIVARSVTTGELRISCLVEEAEANQAVRALHDAFDLGRGEPGEGRS